jgi:hypothetical protein
MKGKALILTWMLRGPEYVPVHGMGVLFRIQWLIFRKAKGRHDCSSNWNTEV